MTDAKELLSEEMIQRIEDCAREQGRKPAEVLEEAIGRYMALQRLNRLSDRIGGRALAQGVNEEDVPGLVEEVRRENRQRGL